MVTINGITSSIPKDPSIDHFESQLQNQRAQKDPPNEEIYIALHASDEIIRDSQKNPSSINAQGCKQFTITPLKKGADGYSDLEQQITKFAKRQGGPDQKVKKMVLNFHGAADENNNPIAGIGIVDIQGPKDAGYELKNIVQSAAKNIEPNGELWCMGCSLVPKTRKGDVVKEQLKKIAIDKKIHIWTTMTVLSPLTKKPNPILLHIFPDGRTEILTKNYNEFNSAKKQETDLLAQANTLKKQYIDKGSESATAYVREKDLEKQYNNLSWFTEPTEKLKVSKQLDSARAEYKKIEHFRQQLQDKETALREQSYAIRAQIMND